jgi:hypothetical protein
LVAKCVAIGACAPAGALLAAITLLIAGVVVGTQSATRAACVVMPAIPC